MLYIDKLSISVLLLTMRRDFMPARSDKECNVKEYYLNRFKWIFNYTSNNFFYIIGKTVCLIVGLPVYLAVFAVEMVLTFVNMLFCWIPILSIVVTVICKGTILIIDQLYYICILTDLKKYREATVVEPDIAEVDYTIYQAADDDAETQLPLDENNATDEQRQTDVQTADTEEQTATSQTEENQNNTAEER